MNTVLGIRNELMIGVEDFGAFLFCAVTVFKMSVLSVQHGIFIILTQRCLLLAMIMMVIF